MNQIKAIGPVSVFMAVFLAGSCLAQELARLQIVGKPEKSATEFVGADVKDINGRICAAVQVISDLDGFTYDAYNDVVKVTSMPGRDMVYLQPDERVLTIFHSGYEPLKIILFEVGIRLEQKAVWVLKISGEKKLEKVPVVIVTTPPGAEVFIDGESQGVVEKVQVAAGSREIRVRKEGFEPVIQTEQVDEKNNYFKYELKKIEDVPLNITTDPPEAVVTIDGLKFGTTPFTNSYPSGRYPILIEKDWYVTYDDFIDIQPPVTRKSYTLRKDYGQLTVTSSPETGLEIVINGKSQDDRTPHTFERLEPGTYRISARTKFFETPEQSVEVQREGIHTVNLVSEGTYATLTIKTLDGATVYLNDKKITRLENIRLEPMVALIRAERPPKGRVVEQRVVLKKRDRITVDVIPDIALGTIQVLVEPFEAEITLKGDAGEVFTSLVTKIFNDIPVGRYELEIRKEGYKTYRNTVTLNEGDEVKEVVKMEEGSDVPEGFVLVEGGTFMMGSTEGHDDEKPVHRVTVSDFFISRYEVTVSDFQKFINATGYRTDAERGDGAYVWTGKWEKKADASWKNPYMRQSDQDPVVCASWNDAVRYCNWISELEGLTPAYTISGNSVTWIESANGYRLPTEAEWEYAARGGNQSRGYTYSGSSSADEVAWYDGNSGNKTHPVGQKKPNELGLYDMSGNVWEWCWDWYGDYGSSSSTDPKGPSSGSSRVLRGGSWGSLSRRLRTANCHGYLPDLRDLHGGFRLFRTL